MNFLKTLNGRLNKLSMQIAGFFLLAMMVLSCGNIFLRIVWVPIKGAYELLGFFSALSAGLALGQTQLLNSHTAVDIVVSRYPKKIRKLADGISWLISGLFFSIAGWQVCAWANNMRVSGELTETLRIIYYPFTYVLGLGCYVLALALWVQFLTLFAKEDGDS